MPGVLLGNIQFVNNEVPDVMKSGSKQMLAIHRVMGGSRVIDAIGPDFPPISWSGLFFGGTSAMVRARACDSLCQSGAEVNLYFGSNAYVVIVEDFSYSYKHEWEVRYTISCQVVSLAAPISFTLPTIDTVIGNDFSAINSIATADPAIPATDGSTSIPSSVSSSITNAQNVIDAASAADGSLANLSLTQLQPSITALETAFQTFEAALVAPAGINLDAITGASTLDGINSFATEAGLASQQSDQMLALSFLERIISNLTTLGG